MTSGRRVRTGVPRTNETPKTVYHMHYVTSVDCSQSGPISTEVRKYSLTDDIVLQGDTIAFVNAKAHIPPGNVRGSIFLEAICMALVPVKLMSLGYMDPVSDFRYPVSFSHGTVIGERENKEGWRCCQ